MTTKFYHDDPGNSGQDAFALAHGEAHLIEFPFGVTIVRSIKYFALASTHEEAKYHATLGNGKLRGYIRADDFSQ